MLGLLAAVLMQATALPPGLIVQPDWLHKPSGGDITRTYPREAWKAGLLGRATIHRGIDDHGRLVDCDVSAEDPPGAGFGETALELSKLFQMKPLSRDGLPTAGGTINIPFRFSAPQRSSR